MSFLMPVAVLLPVALGLLLPACLKGQRLRFALLFTWGAELLIVLAAATRELSALTLIQFQPGMVFTLSADRTSGVFSCLFAAVWLLVGAYSFDYLRESPNQARFFRYYTLTLGMLMGLCYSANLVSFLLFFEAVTLCMLPLVAHDQTEQARNCAMWFAGFSFLGAALALGGLFYLNALGLSTEFSALGSIDWAGHESALIAVYFIMALGLGAKAGLFPLHAWLPVAHPVAPSSASAVLSGVITKCGVLGVLRLTYNLFGADALRGTWAQTALSYLALIAIFIGSMMALRERVIKRRLAYSSVSQLSYALFALTLMSPEGLSAAMTQVLFHSMAKTALFLWAGAVIQRTGCERVDELRGIGREMPVATGCFTIAALSLIGIPPLGGFAAKWSIFQASGDLLGPAMLILSALLTAGYLLPIAAKAYFPGRDYVCVSTRHESPLMCFSMLVLALATLALGLFPFPV